MNLAEAVAQLAVEFGAATDEFEPNDKRVIASGGVKEKPIDPEPALYVSAEAALAAWLREVQTFLREQKPRRWRLVDGPHLDKWLITVMDVKQMHRVGEPRWSVQATIGVVWLTDMQKLAQGA